MQLPGAAYRHVGPMSRAASSQKLNIMAFEHELELTGTVYTIFVNQDEGTRALWIPLWRRSDMINTIRDINELQDCCIMMGEKLPPFGYALILPTAALILFSSWCGAIKPPHLRQPVQRPAQAANKIPYHVQLTRLHH